MAERPAETPRVTAIRALAARIVANGGYLDLLDRGQTRPIRLLGEAALRELNLAIDDHEYADLREAFRLAADPAHVVDVKVGKRPRPLRDRTKLERTAGGWVVTIEDGTPEEYAYTALMYEGIVADMFRALPTREEIDTWLTAPPAAPAPGVRWYTTRPPFPQAE